MLICKTQMVTIISRKCSAKQFYESVTCEQAKRIGFLCVASSLSLIRSFMRVLLSTFSFHFVVTSFCIMKPSSCQVCDLDAKYITLSEFNLETLMDSGDLQHLV